MPDFFSFVGKFTGNFFADRQTDKTRVFKVRWCSITHLIQVFWKCYEYGDDLIQIFEFIDDQRAKSVRGMYWQGADPKRALINHSSRCCYR